VIVDKGATLADGFQAGIDPDTDRARGFLVTDGGITLITPDMLGQHIHEFR
jgi:glucose-1-phosphate adenylyltransferase